jgi:hypothetical protein
VKRRNKYDFKWWHGLMGLVGLSMVLGTIRAVSTGGTMSLPPGGASYRNHVIVLREGEGGVAWTVLDPNGAELETGFSLTSSMAFTEAKRFVDSYIELASPSNPVANRWMHPSQVQTVQGAVGYAPRSSGRPAQITTPPLDGFESWQDGWNRQGWFGARRR